MVHQEKGRFRFRASLALSALTVPLSVMKLSWGPVCVTTADWTLPIRDATRHNINEGLQAHPVVGGQSEPVRAKECLW